LLNRLVGLTKHFALNFITIKTTVINVKL